VTRWVVTVLVLALLVGGGYAAFVGLTGGSSTSGASKLPLCPPAPSAAQPTSPLRLTVENATTRNGLAAAVASDLHRRGFHVTSVGNTTLMTKGVAIVRYSPNRRLVADRVAAQIPGARTLLAGGHGVVELDLGPGFRALASPAQAQHAYLALAPKPTASPAAGRGCRPRA
jgi:LytR cell envelope-related transcriptional attenuator